MPEMIISASGAQTGAVVGLDGSLKTTIPADVYIQKMSSGTNGMIEYRGLSEPGNSTGSSTWQIKKFTYDNNFLTTVAFAGSSQPVSPFLIVSE